MQKVGTEDKSPLTVRLEPTGTLMGRVLGADGLPLAGVKVAASYRWEDIRAANEQGKEFKDLPREMLSSFAWGPVLNREATTDKDGKFRVDGLVPGLKYDLRAEGLERSGLSVDPGKENDLGDLK